MTAVPTPLIDRMADELAAAPSTARRELAREHLARMYGEGRAEACRAIEERLTGRVVHQRHAERQRISRPSLRAIANVAIAACGTSLERLLDHRRADSDAAAKSVYAALGQHWGYSYPEMAAMLGTSHSTLITAHRRIDRHCQQLTRAASMLARRMEVR